jgi:DNA-directed RNA polymerase specialized sigma24 family protein
MTDAASHGSKEARLKRVVGDLSPREREALYRFYTLKHSAAEISRALGFGEEELRELKSRVKKDFLSARWSQ